MKALAWIIALMVAAGFGASNASASAVLSIGSETIAQNGTATVALDISGLGNGTALGTFDVNVGFDPSLVNFTSATYGDPVLGDQLNLEGFGTLTSTTPGTGTTELFELSLDSATALASSQATSFTLATLMFNAVATGNSALTLSVNALGDQNGNPLTASLQNGSITITNTTPVPLPASAWLMLSGLGGLGLLAQRRQLRGV